VSDAPLELVEVAGGPRKRGRALGEAMGARIRAFLERDLAHVNRVRRVPLDRARARVLALSHGRAVGAALPDIDEEIRGLAEGAGIAYEDALLLQARRELIGNGEDCTLVALRDPCGGAVLAQTVDLPGDLTEEGHMLRVRGGTRAGADILMWTHTGLLGYLGLNGHGLAVGINMVLSSGWRPGVPPYLLVRHLLALADVEACLAEIARIPRASSRCLTLADASRTVMVEMTVDAHRAIEVDGPAVHCNHYLHPDFRPLDRIFSGSSTFVRTTRLDALLARAGAPTVDDARAWLADHGGAPASICAHDRGATRGRTVAAVVQHAAEGVVEAARGTPCTASFHAFALRRGNPSQTPGHA
jgi:hypothetical protein